MDEDQMQPMRRGLMAPAQGPQDAPADAEPPAPVEGVEAPAQAPGDPNQATPDEQAAYDAVVANGTHMVYANEKVFQKVLKLLEGNGDPVAGLAKSAASLIMRVQGSLQQAGKSVPIGVLFHAGTELFGELANLATKAGIHDFRSDPDAVEAAYYAALDDVRQMMVKAGMISPEAAKAEWAALQQKDQSGELGEMFKGLMARGQQGEPPSADDPQIPPMRRGLMPRNGEG